MKIENLNSEMFLSSDSHLLEVIASFILLSHLFPISPILRLQPMTIIKLILSYEKKQD